MYKGILCLFIFLAIFSWCSICSCEELWERVSGITASELKELAVDIYNDGVIYTASDKALYKSSDHGKNWKQVFMAKGEYGVINFIAVSGKAVFICTQNGLYSSKDGESNWRKVFKGIGENENNISHLAFLNDKAYLATKAGLFESKDNCNTWQRAQGEAGSLSIRWIEPVNEQMFLASEKGVYRVSNAGWERVFVTRSEEKDEYDTSAEDEPMQAVKPVYSILAHKNKIYLGTGDGVFVSEDNGSSWNQLSQEGLVSKNTRRLLFFNNDLYTATDEGVFVFINEGKIWKALYKGINTKYVYAIASGRKDDIWLTASNGLYRTNAMQIALFIKKDDIEYKKEDVLAKFNAEPSIRDVQVSAIDYAEVNPDKITQWREQAKKKALLPNVSVGVDRYVTDLYHWDTGSTTTTDALIKGDDTVSWDITMTWDMGEFIWNDDQTSIDTRSKLMVQLRDEIMDEVTRTYFERRRLQAELLTNPPKDLERRIEKDLRLQELTADLDALTGGYFCRHLK